MRHAMVSADLAGIGAGNAQFVEMNGNAFVSPALAFEFKHVQPSLELGAVLGQGTHMTALLPDPATRRQFLHDLPLGIH